LRQLASSDKVVAIGECGLDYFYNHSSKKISRKDFKISNWTCYKTQIAVNFHVRNGFDDFWPILDSYPKIRGVLHSFTDDQTNLDKAIERGLFIGVNGIATFLKI